MWSSFDVEGGVHLVITSRFDGDQRPGFGCCALDEVPVQFAHQVHGAEVAVVDGAGAQLPLADALATEREHLALAMLGADCSLVAMVGANRAIAIAHVGWRGLLAGVIANAVDALRTLGERSIAAYVGPTIGPECYEFSDDDLDLVAERFGPAVRSTTAAGRPALDVPAGVDAALAEAGVAHRVVLAGCTACDERRYSFRARHDEERHALYLWRAR